LLAGRSPHRCDQRFSSFHAKGREFRENFRIRISFFTYQLVAATNDAIRRTLLQQVSALSAVSVEPLSDLSHDLVDLKRLQEVRFLFRLHPPRHQDLAHSLLVVSAFNSNLLDSRFPFLKTHRLFLFDFKLQMRGCHGVVDELDDRILAIARD
jgi:hypothetical protein